MLISICIFITPFNLKRERRCRISWYEFTSGSSLIIFMFFAERYYCSLVAILWVWSDLIFFIRYLLLLLTNLTTTSRTDLIYRDRHSWMHFSPTNKVGLLFFFSFFVVLKRSTRNWTRSWKGINKKRRKKWKEMTKISHVGPGSPIVRFTALPLFWTGLEICPLFLVWDGIFDNF